MAVSQVAGWFFCFFFRFLSQVVRLFHHGLWGFQIAEHSPITLHRLPNSPPYRHGVLEPGPIGQADPLRQSEGLQQFKLEL